MTPNGKIGCAVCSKWHGHIVVEHLREKHPDVDVLTYVESYNAPIASARGFEALRRHNKVTAQVSTRERASSTVAELFGLNAEKAPDKNPGRKFVNKTMSHFTEPHALTPARDPNYVFPENALRRVLMGVALPERNRVWLHGYAGTGKTQLAQQVAACLNYGLLRVNGDANISRRQLIGDFVVKNGETHFQHGVLPEAMRNGHILLIDEIDHFAPPVLAIFRGVLEDPSRLVLLENGGEVLQAHPDFRVIATANTAGAGDETGLFVTSRALSLADRQRFAIWAKIDYLPPAAETGMLKKRFPKLQDIELRRFYQVVKAIRDQHKSGHLEESFSPREFVNWVEKYVLMGDVLEAAWVCFIDRYQSPSVQLAVAELVRAAFDENKQPAQLPEAS